MSAEIRRLLDDIVQRLNALVTQWREDAGRRELGRTDYRLSEREMAVYQKCATQLEQLAALLAAPAVPAQEEKQLDESFTALTAYQGACQNCGHDEPHNGPAGDVHDACTHPGCDCGFDSRSVAVENPKGSPTLAEVQAFSRESLITYIRQLWAAMVPQDETSVLQAVLDAIKGTLDTSSQIADHPNVKFAQMQRLKWTSDARISDTELMTIAEQQIDWLGNLWHDDRGAGRLALLSILMDIRDRSRSDNTGQLTDAQVDAFLATYVETDPARVARIRAKFDVKVGKDLYQETNRLKLDE